MDREHATIVEPVPMAQDWPGAASSRRRHVWVTNMITSVPDTHTRTRHGDTAGTRTLAHVGWILSNST